MTRADRAASLDRLADVIANADLRLAGADRDELLALRDRLAHDVEGQAARARDVGAPLLVVVGGVTGAGKSTLVNTLVGRPLVPTGVIRPTTTTPALVCAPADVPWFTTPRVLPTLARQVVAPNEVDEAPDPGTALRILPVEERPEGVALLDAPDVDSVSAQNRRLADLLLDAADLWIWCTTVGKYADEESMAYLRRAERRGTSLLVVLTQVRDADRSVVLEDFANKLAGAGVRPSALLTVGWTDASSGMVERAAVADLAEEIDRLVDPEERRRQREHTLDGAIAALDADLRPLLQAVLDEQRAAADLVRAVDAAYDAALADFASSVDEGLPLRGEVLGRWTDFVGSSRLFEVTGRVAGGARQWVSGLLAGGSVPSERRLEREVRGEVTDTVTQTLVRLADLAAEQVERTWSASSAGQRLLADAEIASTSDPDLPARSLAAVEGWQEGVVRLVADQGVARRSRARWMSTAVNALATGAIVVALASTGGLTGAEAGIAAAAGAANQALLVTVLGERTVRWLVTQARLDLVERAGEVLAPERRRRNAAVAAAAPDDELLPRLRRALAEARR